MNISGSGTIAAGEYNERISVSGSGRINGNIRCIGLHCAGSVTGKGDVDCKEDIGVSGSCHFGKSIFAESVKVSGSMKVEDDMTVTKIIKSNGSSHCEGSVRCSVLNCSGSIRAGKEIEADEVSISGMIHCEGLLNAEKIDISLGGTNGSSRIGSIGGSEIRISKDQIRRKNGGRGLLLSLFARLMGNKGGDVTVTELIEGDTIDIECVKAPRVVGRVVTIGAECEIDLVQYSEAIEINPDAKVGKYEKI